MKFSQLKEKDPKFFSMLEKVDNGYMNEKGKSSSCWEYTGTLFSNGYGRLYKPTYAPEENRAHRYAFILSNGKIPKRAGKQLLVLHKCDNRKCCNPSHIYADDHRKNMKDMTLRGRQARGETSGVSTHRAEEVAFVKLLLEVGFSYTDVQDMMLLARSTVGRFALDVSWKHVPPMKKKKELIIAFLRTHAVRMPIKKEVHGWNANSKPLPVRCVKELVSVYGQIEVALMLGSTRKIVRSLIELPDETILQVDPKGKTIKHDDPRAKIRQFILDQIKQGGSIEAA